ncbi:PadR family transcriptional regulator [Frankia sp. Mgl5]|uniref:PadR family transcriptional regulator n=1 Tax=Frankia sp. Mgl5 TaxID=2933793 RepID=UPI00200D69E6|nr:helix-turn-helix transcriptional regulator [Frankia sp. Mgl5]MCK9925841.1 PadR family transcriptional regulator [Frankia sp. Mgl5]
MAGQFRVTPATLDVLEALLDGEVEPYGLAIAKRAGLATGSVFPILARLERLEWITSSWEDTDRPGPRRRLYRFTPEGMAGARVLLAERRGRGAGQRRGLGGFTSAPEGAR